MQRGQTKTLNKFIIFCLTYYGYEYRRTFYAIRRKKLRHGSPKSGRLKTRNIVTL